MHSSTGTGFAFLIFALTKFILKRSLTSLGRRHCLSLTSCHTISIITQECCKKFHWFNVRKMLHQEWHYMQLNLNYTKNYPMNYSVSSTQIKLAERKKPKWPTWPFGDGRWNCRATVYVKTLKEAVCASRHSTHSSVSLIIHTYNPEGEKEGKFHFMKVFPWALY